MKIPLIMPQSLKVSKNFEFVPCWVEPRLTLKDGVASRTMSAAKAKALSVEKWTIVRDYLGMVHKDPLPVYGLRTGAQYSCGFCIKYHQNDCKDCPVYARTGQRFCIGTPHDDFLCKPSPETAQDEIDFLLSMDVPRVEDTMDPRERAKREQGGPE